MTPRSGTRLGCFARFPRFRSAIGGALNRYRCLDANLFVRSEAVPPALLRAHENRGWLTRGALSRECER